MLLMILINWKILPLLMIVKKNVRNFQHVSFGPIITTKIVAIVGVKMEIIFLSSPVNQLLLAHMDPGIANPKVGRIFA